MKWKMEPVIKQVKPKILTLNTPCVRNQRTLIWLQNDVRNFKKWDAVVTSITDFKRWNNHANIVGIIIESIPVSQLNTFYEDLFAISSHVPMILLANTILKPKSQAYWTDNYDNVMNLDALEEDYPFLQMPWDGTKEDAVALFAHLHRYNRIVDCHVTEVRFNSFQGNITVEHQITPPTISLVTQYFRHPDAARAKEILTCLEKNTQCQDIKTIFLLTEKDYSKDWQHLRTHKIQQFIIKKRLTYAHFIQFVKDRVPKNTIAILANADVFMDDLTDLWKINLTRKMLALLRWDVKDLEDLTTAEIFGPRADSQDAWVVLSDSVKEVNWDYTRLNIELGQLECDNAFAGTMLSNRFVLYNPALTIKTYHLHKTEIRNYRKEDAIKSTLYINMVPTYVIDTKQEKPEAIHHLSNELVSFHVKSSSTSNELTYCTMLAKDGRYTWEPQVENHYFDPAIPVYSWRNACVTPNGLVYTPYTIYPGDDEKYPYWLNSDVTIFTPMQQTTQMLAIPFEDTTVFDNANVYILYYLSRALRLLSTYPDASFWVPEHAVEYLADFNIQSKPLIIKQDMTCYAREVIGYVPQSLELGKEDVAILRDHLPLWIPSAFYKRCVFVGDFQNKTQLSEIFKGWVIYYETDPSFESLMGAPLCIVHGGRETWSKLWALPTCATVIEFQQELDVQGELQHLAHVCELQSWVLLLSKGTEAHVQQQIVQQLSKWVVKNLYNILNQQK